MIKDSGENPKDLQWFFVIFLATTGDLIQDKIFPTATPNELQDLCTKQDYAIFKENLLLSLYGRQFLQDFSREDSSSESRLCIGSISLMVSMVLCCYSGQTEAAQRDAG